jgi:cytochrome c peroxidase
MKKLLTISFIICFIGGCSYFLGSCKKREAVRVTPVSFPLPAGFPAPSYNLGGNPLTEEGIALGRRLFYEGRLSKDGNFPCSSCHQQVSAFGTFDHDLSHGYNNSHTLRNAMPLFNLAWQQRFHHDGAYSDLDIVPIYHITSPVEMAETVDAVLVKLRADSRYREMFRAAFGDDEINNERMMKALAQFTVSMVSADSKYDRVKAGRASFTQQEQQGYQLFQTKCASCHTEPLFTDGSFRNTGLPLIPNFDDIGRAFVTRDPADSMKFRVPTLRNVMATYPYMHDGRFWSIDQVMLHYRSGIRQSASLDPSLRNGIPSTTTESRLIEMFLHTLTDSTFLTNPKFSRPQ